MSLGGKRERIKIREENEAHLTKSKRNIGKDIMKKRCN